MTDYAFKARARLAIEQACHYCGKPATTADHIVPRSAGGPDKDWNLVSACRPCNAGKAAAWPTCQCDRCRGAEARFILGRERWT